MKVLYWALNRYYRRLWITKLLKKEGLTFEKLKMIGKVRKVQYTYRIFIRNKKIKNVYSYALQTIYRMHHAESSLPVTLYANDFSLIMTEHHA